MRTIGKVFAFLVACVLVLTLPLTLWMYNAGQFIFDAARVKTAMLDLLLEENLLPVAMQSFAAQAGAGDMTEGLTAEAVQELFGRLTLQDWKMLQQALLPERILVPWVSATVEGVYTWFNSDAPFPVVVLEMREFKKNIVEGGGEQAVQLIFDTLPPCTAEQVNEYTSGVTAGAISPCRLPDPGGAAQMAVVLDMLEGMATNLPDTVDLTSGMEGRAAGALGLYPLKLQLGMAQTAARWAPWLGAALLLLIWALAVRSLRELGRWWGIPLLLGGALTLALGLGYPALLNTGRMIGPLSGLPSAVQGEALKAVAFLLAKVFDPLVVQGSVLAGAGLVLLIVGLVARPPEDDALTRLSPR